MFTESRKELILRYDYYNRITTTETNSTVFPGFSSIVEKTAREVKKKKNALFPRANTLDKI